MEEQQVKMAIRDLSDGEPEIEPLTQKISELANSAYLVYVSQKSLRRNRQKRLKGRTVGLRGFELKDADRYVLFFGCPAKIKPDTQPKSTAARSIAQAFRNPILLQLPIKRSLPYPQQPSRHQLISIQLLDRSQNGVPLHLRN
jgi:hypothetical protein